VKQAAEVAVSTTQLSRAHLRAEEAERGSGSSTYVSLSAHRSGRTIQLQCILNAFLSYALVCVKNEASRQIYIFNITPKNRNYKITRGLQPYHLVGAITGQGMLFWRFGHVRVRSMIITLRTYLHAHVPFMTFMKKEQARDSSNAMGALR
jgi:hypothetical protein